MGRWIWVASLLSVSLSFLPSSLGSGVICESLPEDLCAFSISWEGKRCVLESYRRRSGDSGRETTEYHCKTSEVMVERASDWIETDECVKACGAERREVGISSDALLDPRLTAKLCSPACYGDCPFVVDLYFNLAAGEGVSLPDLCEAHRSNPRRSIAEAIQSSGSAAAGDAAPYPAPSP